MREEGRGVVDGGVGEVGENELGPKCSKELMQEKKWGKRNTNYSLVWLHFE